MLSDVIGDLACGVCGEAVTLSEDVVRCDEGHSFDVARQGYVSMLPGRGAPGGDSADMVGARERFLAGGHFDELTGAVATAAASASAGGPGCVVDVGAGTGWYLARVLDALPGRGGIALDSSAAALRRAARCHPRAGAVGCDVWTRLPVRTGAAAVTLNVFAPRNGSEMSRVLAPGGALVVATPTARHLQELVERLGLVRVDADKERRLADALGEWFRPEAETVVEHPMRLSRGEIADVVAMGPSARHVTVPPEGLPEEVVVTCSVRVSTFVSSP